MTQKNGQKWMKTMDEVKVIRKILIKCPRELESGFALFPFFITLSEEFPKAELFLLCEEGTTLAYSFLPIKVKAYERPADKLSLMETHKYCANLHDIFNIDIFFDLENTVNSAFMGFNFRVPERIGFETGWNKYFLTQKFPNDPQLSIEKKAIRLLENYFKRSFSEVRVARTREEGTQIEKIEQLFKEPEPPKFIMIMLDNFKNVSTQVELWTKFFDCFHGQKFIIWSQFDQDMISELFSSVDLGHNSLYMQNGSDSKEMIYLLNKVKGAVTNNLWSEGLTSFFGMNSVSFFTDSLLKLPHYDFFRYKPQRFFIPSVDKIQYSYLEEERELQVINQVVDHLHFYFKL